MERSVQVVVLGHPIVDVLSPCPDEDVAALGLEKGTMALVDEEQAETLYSRMGPATEVSGGAAANTAAGVASLGGSVRFIGKVADDGLGKVFTHDIRAAGVEFDVAPATDGEGSGRCLILVTPDAERTMCTFLGAGAGLGPADVDPAAIGGARVVYLEGYLCGKPETEAAIEAAVEAARRARVPVAFSASDPSWVDLNRAALVALLDRVDILFANELEAIALSGADGLDDAVDILAGQCATVAVTLGAQGSVVASGAERIRVPAVEVSHVVDTTGAGDSFAAGFLYGFVNEMSPERCARLGSIAAAEVVSHIGARPLASLGELAREAGLV